MVALEAQLAEAEGKVGALGIDLLAGLLAIVANPLLESTDLDMPLKKLAVRRYCSVSSTEEAMLVRLLVGRGHLTSDAPASWDEIVDLHEALNAERNRAAQYRQQPAEPDCATVTSRCLHSCLGLPQPEVASRAQPPPFFAGKARTAHKPIVYAPLRRGAKLTAAEQAERDRSLASNPRALAPDVDVSASDGFEVLSRLRASARPTSRAKPAASDFRTLCLRAYERDGTLTRVDLSNDRDFAALPADCKRQCVEALAMAARGAALEEVRLDGLCMDVVCGSALATLLSSPKLRLLSVARNKLAEGQVLLLAV